MLKRTALFLLAGLGLGVVVSMWFGPELIGWWSGPLVPTAISCEPQILAATRELVKLELGLGLGVGVLFAIVGNVVVKRRQKKASAIATAPAPAIADASTKS